MTPTRRAAPDPEVEAEVELYDQISEEEAAQAEAGTLFSIQGERFANVDWSIHRYRTRREMVDDPSGEKTEWVTDITGELRGQDLVDLIGGGTFRFYGYVPRAMGGRKLAFNRLIRLAGPRRDFTLSATPPPAVTSLPASDSDRRLDRLEQMIINLAARPQPAPAQTSMTELVNTLVALRGLTPDPPNAATDIKTVLDVMHKGIEIGQMREPAEPGEENTTLKIVEALAPIAGRMLDQFAAARGQRPRVVTPPPPPGATVMGGPAPPAHTPTEPATPSNAQVVDDTAPDKRVSESQMIAVIALLARGIREQIPVDELADAIALILPEAELDEILSTPREAVVQELVTQAGGLYPVLAEPQGREYLLAVFAELAKDEEPAPAAPTP